MPMSSGLCRICPTLSATPRAGFTRVKLTLCRSNDLDGAGGVDGEPALLIANLAFEKADRAAPAQHTAFGNHVTKADRPEETDLELERRHRAGEALLGEGCVRHGDVDHTGQEAALADRALRMAEGRH